MVGARRGSRSVLLLGVVFVVGHLFMACARDGVTPGDGSGGASVVGSGGASGSGATGNGGATGGFASGGVPGSGGRGGRGDPGSGGSGSGGNGASASGGAPFVPFRCPSGPFPAPVLNGLSPSRVPGVPPIDAFNNNGNDFGIFEGPVWAGDALYVSQLGFAAGTSPPSRILKVTPAGAVTVAVDNAGTNGLALDSAGNLVGANFKDGAITRFTFPAFTPTHLVATNGGQPFDSPNDLAFRADGNLYFSDPDYQAAPTRPQARTRLYRLAPGASTATVIDENRGQPNGVTLSPDGNTLYVSGNDGLFKYAVAADGSVGPGMKIAQSIGGGDGMAIDCGGNVYVATNSTLSVVDPSGNPLGMITINTGGGTVTNAAFGGADHRTLYITALGTGMQGGLFAVGMNVPGYPY